MLCTYACRLKEPLNVLTKTVSSRKNLNLQCRSCRVFDYYSIWLYITRPIFT